MKTTLTRSALALAALLAVFTVPAHADQPHMDAALNYLQQAKAELQQAEHNKGGWRVEAIKQVDAAIKSIQNGKSAADS